MVRGYISDKFGKKYLPDSANQYASKENSQEAHEAIRPSDVNVLAETLKVRALPASFLCWRTGSRYPADIFCQICR